MADILGQGVAFPLRVDRRGGLALVRGDEDIYEAIGIILGTAPGERPMRPEFGCGIHDLIFAPSNSTTAGQAAYEVRRSLSRWEPRVDVDDVAVTYDEADTSLMYIAITYRVRGSNDPRNLVFPFYTIPSEE